MRRYGLRDGQWERIKDFLPGRAGHVGNTVADNMPENSIYKKDSRLPFLSLKRRHYSVSHEQSAVGSDIS